MHDNGQHHQTILQNLARRVMTEHGLLPEFSTHFQLGIRARGRVHYWRLFFWTLFLRSRLFPLAITLAIYGFHFSQVITLHVA